MRSSRVLSFCFLVITFGNQRCFVKTGGPISVAIPCLDEVTLAVVMNREGAVIGGLAIANGRLVAKALELAILRTLLEKGYVSHSFPSIHFFEMRIGYVAEIAG